VARYHRALENFLVRQLHGCQTCTGTAYYLTTKEADSRATKNQGYILHVDKQDPKVWASNSLFEILVFFEYILCVVVVVIES
jgi:hypothetical protein